MSEPAPRRSSRNYAKFTINRTRLVRLQAKVTREGVPGFFDFSGSRWVVWLRFSALPLALPTTFERAYAMPKLPGDAADGDTGKAEVLVTLPTVRAACLAEWVAADQNAADSTTPSGKVEYALDLPWECVVGPSPGP
jgi:hypothetical protein